MKANSYGLILLTIGSALIAGQAMAQSNARPELKRKQLPRISTPARDSKGNLVISDPAVVPRGANEPVGIGISRDPKEVFRPQVSNEVYKLCSKTVTDNCLQGWEPPREIPNCPGDPECPEPG